MNGLAWSNGAILALVGLIMNVSNSTSPSRVILFDILTTHVLVYILTEVLLENPGEFKVKSGPLEYNKLFIRFANFNK